MEKETLLKFIAKAHRNTYAASKEIREQHACKTPILEGHKDYEYIEGNLKYHDSYAGSTWAPGREVISLKGEPFWAMAYQGKDNDQFESKFYQEKVFPFLKNALTKMEDDMPFRGPKEYAEKEFKYTFKMNGDYKYFTGKEIITYKKEIVFSQDVMGSLIK